MKLNGKPTIYYDRKRKKYVVSSNQTNTATEETKRVRKSFNTEQEAELYKRELEYKSENSIFIKNDSIPLCELMKFVVDRKYKNHRISEQQYGKNLETISKIEKSKISKKDISDITSEELQNYFKTLTNYSYMQKFITQFSQAFNYAYAKGYIHINPMLDTYTPQSTKDTKVVRALELSEQQKLTDYLKNKTIDEEPYKNAFLIQLYSGLRIGEVLALQDKDIDLKNKIIHIRKTLTRSANNQIIMGNKTKTFAGVRDVPIQEIIFKEVKEQVDISKNHFNGQLFTSKNGRYADPKCVNKILKRIMLNTCCCNDITTHSLRHTFRNSMY